MKNLIKIFRKAFLISALVLFTAVTSSIATMVWAVGLPTEEHIAIHNRWLNWPEKPCYPATEIDMIIEGP